MNTQQTRYPCIRCLKTFVRKETLIQHLMCQTICNSVSEGDESRQDYLKEVRKRSFRKSLGLVTESTPGCDIIKNIPPEARFYNTKDYNYLKDALSIKSAYIDYTTYTQGYDFMATTFCRYFSKCIYVHNTRIIIKMASNEVLCLKRSQFYWNVLSPWIDILMNGNIIRNGKQNWKKWLQKYNHQKCKLEPSKCSKYIIKKTLDLLLANQVEQSNEFKVLDDASNSEWIH